MSDLRRNGRQRADPFRPELWGNERSGRRPASIVPPQPAASPMTFGVEIEFITFFRRLLPGQRANNPAVMSANAGYVVVEHGATEMDIHRATIRALRAAGLDINDVGVDEWTFVPPPGAPRLTRHSANAGDPTYHRWTLSYDSSVAVYGHELAQHAAPLLPNGTRLVTRFLGCELVSPAMSFVLENFDELRTVVVKLRALYRTRVNDTTGLHVHVGIGPRPIAVGPLKRIACVLWTIDAIMNPIHPQDRRDNHYCRRNRQYCNLARGMQAVNALGQPGPGLRSEFEERDDVSIGEGVHILKECETAGQVALLMLAASPAYNFSPYVSLPLGNLADPNRKYTIEFRQAAASLNAVWIAHWAYLCVRICEWAAYEMDWGYLDVLVVRCSRVEDGLDGWSAALRDFLIHIGCENIASFIAGTTMQQRAGV